MKLRIGEVARRVKLHPETLRRLERRGLIVSIRDVNRHRLYDQETVLLLRKLYRRDPAKTPPSGDANR